MLHATYTQIGGMLNCSPSTPSPLPFHPPFVGAGLGLGLIPYRKPSTRPPFGVVRGANRLVRCVIKMSSVGVLQGNIATMAKKGYTPLWGSHRGRIMGNTAGRSIRKFETPSRLHQRLHAEGEARKCMGRMLSPLHHSYDCNLKERGTAGCRASLGLVGNGTAGGSRMCDL